MSIYPVPLGVSVKFWFDPPAAKAIAPVPVIEPVAVPVPPFATATVPVTLAALPEILPEISEPGMDEEAVNADDPFPFTYPVSVVAPVPPLPTAMAVPDQFALLMELRM